MNSSPVHAGSMNDAGRAAHVQRSVGDWPGGPKTRPHQIRDMRRLCALYMRLTRAKTASAILVRRQHKWKETERAEIRHLIRARSAWDGEAARVSPAERTTGTSQART